MRNHQPVTPCTLFSHVVQHSPFTSLGRGIMRKISNLSSFSCLLYCTYGQVRARRMRYYTLGRCRLPTRFGSGPLSSPCPARPCLLSLLSRLGCGVAFSAASQVSSGHASARKMRPPSSKASYWRILKVICIPIHMRGLWVSCLRMEGFWKSSMHVLIQLYRDV